MDPADSFKLAAAAPKPALSHLWPESFIAGLALGLTAYGAVVVARRRQERSVSDADLDLFLTSSTSENQETSTDLLKVYQITRRLTAPRLRPVLFQTLAALNAAPTVV